MADFEINGVEYTSKKMDAKTQAKLIKRLAPLIPAINGVIAILRTGSAPKDTDVLQAIVDGLQKLRDEDIDFIMDETLSLVKRKDATGWVFIWSKPAGRPMDEDTFDLVIGYNCIASIIQAELTPFFR